MVGHDGVNESETTVIIHINDVNDLPPVFLKQSYEATIFEETIHTSKRILKVGWVTTFEKRRLVIVQFISLKAMPQEMFYLIFSKFEHIFDLFDSFSAFVDIVLIFVSHKIF